MNGILTKAGWLVVAAALMAGISACNTADKLQPEDEASAVDAPKTYTLTVTATKGDDDATRALTLSLDGITLNTTWAETEKVIVYKEAPSPFPSMPGIPMEIGTLHPTDITSDGTGCTLRGELDPEKVAQTGGIAEGDLLQLVFPGSLGTEGGAEQDGTLETIQNYYDRAHADVHVLGVSGSAIATEAADFTNEKAIVRFILKDRDGHYFTPSSVAITQTHEGYDPDPAVEFGDFASTYSANGGCFYYAISGLSGGDFGGDIQLMVTNSSNETYLYEKTGVGFTAGKFYSITVKMRRRLVDLSKLTGNYTARDGDILTGSLSDYYKISIANGASVTLSDVTIPGYEGYDNDKPWAGITCLGNATISLRGTNSVKGYHINYPGIQVGGKGKALTLEGSGTLVVTYGGNIDGAVAAGIGAGRNMEVGNIIITGGNIEAYGGQDSAGIGSGLESGCGDITISGGIVHAESESCGAGIGSGVGNYNNVKNNCGNISISGGMITATGGDSGAGIGSGRDATCGDISITGGTISATGSRLYMSASHSYQYGAGIGSGAQADCGDITITAPATGTASGPAGSTWDIGPGTKGSCGAISVASGTIIGRIKGRSLATATAEVVGMLIGADGWIYPNASDAAAAGTTPVALICHLGDAGSADAGSNSYRGLAIALQDANNGNTTTWCNQTEVLCRSSHVSWGAAITDMNGIQNTQVLAENQSHAHNAAVQAISNNGVAAPSGTSGWFLPSAGQWNKLMVGLLGGDGLSESENSQYTASSFNAKFTEVGLTGSGLHSGSSKDYYWWSTEANKLYTWSFYYRGKMVLQNKTDNRYVRAILAF